MKAVIFIHILYLILMRTFMVKGSKCESKVELRAVLLSCPPKDTGCDDDDPLTQVMKAEESQLLQANSKNFQALKDEREKGYPSAVRDCKRKIVITLKIKNVGKIPCDDQYIVIDHVFDPVTGGRGRLLSPVVLKLRQEQMIQLYALQFQRVVNSDPFEEQKAADKTCSVDPENPTCGIAMYDGKPIPFSEGFCCSCDPHVNAKRQLSPVSHGDSFLYRDSKLISQGNSRLTRSEDKGSAIVNPRLVRLRGGGAGECLGEGSGDKKGGDCGGISDPQSLDRVPNFLLERDRKIVCDRGDFMNELCKLRDERNRAGGNGQGKGAVEEEEVVEKVRMGREQGKVEGSGELKGYAVLKGLMEALDVEGGAGVMEGEGESSGEGGEGDKYVQAKGSRGKRENRKESKQLSLEEKLERFANAKKQLTKRKKRLLELSRRRFRKSGEECPNGQGCQTATDYMQDDYVRSPPPKYFFSHDRFIVDPLETPEVPMNTTCRSSEMTFDGSTSAKKRKYHHAGKNDMYKSLGEKGDKAMRSGYYQRQEKGQGKVRGKEKYSGGKAGNKKERVSHNEGGRIENSLGRAEGKEHETGERMKQTISLRGEKRLNLYRGAGERGREKVSKELKENERLLGEDVYKPSKSKAHGKNLKGFLRKSSLEKKTGKPKIRNFFMARNRERQKYRSDLVKNQKSENIGDKKDNFEGKNFKELLRENAKRIDNHQSFRTTTAETELRSNEGTPEGSDNSEVVEMTQSSTMSDMPMPFDTTESPSFSQTSPNTNVFTTNSFGLSRVDYSFQGDSSKHKTLQDPQPQYPTGQHLQNTPPTSVAEERHPNRVPTELAPDMDFKVEIIHNTYPDIPKHRHHAATTDRRLNARLNARLNTRLNTRLSTRLKAPSDAHGNQRPSNARYNLYYKPPEKYYIIGKDHFLPQDVFFIQGSGGSPEEPKLRQYYLRDDGMPKLSRPEAGYSPAHHKKPTRRLYVPVVEYAEAVRQRQGASGGREGRGKRYSEWVVEGAEGGREGGDWGGEVKGRSKRSARYSFEPARGFLRSELESGRGEEELVHELGGCVGGSLGGSGGKKGPVVERWGGGMERWELGSRTKPENLSMEAKMIWSLEEVERRLSEGFMGGREMGKREKKSRRGSDKERLVQSYLNAPEYVLEEVEAALKGKRQASDLKQGRESARGREMCEKELAGEYTQDTAHCMRFGDLWYSLYSIKRPVVAQTVGIQLFDKHSRCDGTTRWRELTKGKMVRLGTFLPKAEDELPSVSMTYIGGKTNKVESAIDPDNYLLLIPSHVSDPSKVNSYPQLEGGPEEYLVVSAKDVSLGGECNMIGTSFEAFARQPDRCGQRRGSCLKRQPVDLWREDMEARIRGKRGKYFVENFGAVPNSPVKTYTNLTGEFLALEYYGEYTSVIEIEMKADSNAIIRKGSNAQIPLVYIDNTYPKKTRIMLSVLNIGLTASYFRPRLGDCPPDLDPAWCPLQGPLVVIPPHQRHDFKLDLSGSLPSSHTSMTVQVLNQLNNKIAQRKIVIRKGDRCICAFHCKCNCIGSSSSSKVCRKLKLEDYRKAGYIGPYPFRGGAASASSESIFGSVHIVFLTASYVLLFLGMIKGVLGPFFRRIGIAGVRVITGPRQLCQYYEPELQGCSVLYDDYGFPVHPTTCQPVQIVPLWVEAIINFLFFFLYPLRGIWFLIMSLPCCKAFCIEFDSSGQEDDSDHKCCAPLLSKSATPTCVHYNLTTFNTKKLKQDEYLPYLPYKGDDDPLEEDDTEFVLQEMKKYRKK